MTNSLRLVFLVLFALSIPARAEQRLRIVVRPSAGDTTVANAYVSLVSPDRPWSRPVAETIARDGVAAVDVPAGEYRIVAGAPGSGVAVKGPVTVSPEAGGEVEIRLPAMQTITGTVRDGGGKPLGGVTVADVNALVEAPLGRLSELARRHLASQWTTVSSEDGTWSLRLPADAKNPLVAQLAGRSAGWQSHKGESAPVSFILGEGASLRVTLDRADPGLVVTLVANDDAHPIPAAWQGQFRARRASAPAVAWDSLAPGSYDVYAQPADPRTFAKAAKLGAVTLERGASREVAFALPAATAAPKEVASFFVDRLSRAGLQSLEVFGTGAAGAPAQIAHALEETSGGTVVHLNATAARAPFYGLTNDRFLAMADGEAEVLDRAYAGLHVRSGDPALTMPGAGVAVLHKCGHAPQVVLPVTVKKDGTVTFAGPAGCGGLKLAFAPFGPLTLPRALNATGETEWLGDFTLYAAGTAGVRIVNDGGTPVADGMVSIQARTATAGESLPVASGKTRADGWIYFDDLPGGRELHVTATAANGQQSPPQPFRVQPREQTLVDVVIPRAATLTVKATLDPDFLKIFPNSHIEVLILDAENAVSREEQRRQEVHERDSVTFEELRPGRWQMLALVATGTTMQPVRGELVEIAPGASKAIAANFKPLVFRGRITAKGKGVQGNLDVIGSRRSDIVPSIGTSETGEFLVLLAREDTYQVGVRTREPMRMMWIGDVEFRDPARFVELTVPDHDLVAAVRANGEPVANATVSARLQRDGTSGMQALDTMPTPTGASGEARIEGLLPGVWIVTAVDESGRRAERRVTIADRQVARVELELAPAATISGTVRQAYGAPVPGARVACVLPSTEGPAETASAWTADDGTFALDRGLARGTALCSVTSLFGSEGFRVAAGGPATLTLPVKSATLDVVSLPPVNRATTLWLVSEDGRLVDATPYVRSNGATASLQVPALAPHRWKLVRVASVADWLSLTGGSASLLAPLADVTLEAGERETVKLETKE